MYDNDGLTPLMLAVKLGHTKIVSYLSEQADINIKCTDKNGKNLMHYAAKLKTISIIKILHRIGLDHRIPDLNGVLPIDIAIEMKNKPMIEYINNITKIDEEEEEEEYNDHEYLNNEEQKISLSTDKMIKEDSDSDDFLAAEEAAMRQDDIV